MGAILYTTSVRFDSPDPMRGYGASYVPVNLFMLKTIEYQPGSHRLYQWLLKGVTEQSYDKLGRVKALIEIADKKKGIGIDILSELEKARKGALGKIMKTGYEQLMNFDKWKDMVEQAKFLLTHFPDVKVVLLKTPVEIIVKRLSSRRVCPKCGRIYNMIFDPPQNDEICDICKVKLVRREDDEPELIRKRIKIQEKGLREVLGENDKLLKKL